jgi:hypothetical protein
MGITVLGYDNYNAFGISVASSSVNAGYVSGVGQDIPGYG